MNMAEIYNRNTTQITRSRSRLTQILHFYFFIIFHFLCSVTNVSLGTSGKLNSLAEPRERATVLYLIFIKIDTNFIARKGETNCNKTE